MDKTKGTGMILTLEQRMRVLDYLLNTSDAEKIFEFFQDDEDDFEIFKGNKEKATSAIVDFINDLRGEQGFNRG
jgi:hypothetical protein